jgi:hypothetical protein
MLATGKVDVNDVEHKIFGLVKVGEPYTCMFHRCRGGSIGG